MPDKSSASAERAKAVTTLALEMREAIQIIAGPRSNFPDQKVWLARAARVLGLRPRTVSALYHGEMPDPRTSVSDRVRAARDEAIAREQEARRREAENAARAEFSAVRDQLATLAHRLSTLDPDGNSESILVALGPLGVGGHQVVGSCSADGSLDRG